MREISLTDDILDSRNIDQRISDLETEVEMLPEVEREGSDEAEELKMWKDFKEQGDNSEWSYGCAFISDRHFEEYARELAEDIDAVSPDHQWPLDCIDWSAAADALKMDYTEIEIDGYTFWCRS